MADECALSVPEQNDRQNNPIETLQGFLGDASKSAECIPGIDLQF